MQKIELPGLLADFDWVGNYEIRKIKNLSQRLKIVITKTVLILLLGNKNMENIKQNCTKLL